MAVREKDSMLDLHTLTQEAEDAIRDKAYMIGDYLELSLQCQVLPSRFEAVDFDIDPGNLSNPDELSKPGPR